MVYNLTLPSSVEEGSVNLGTGFRSRTSLFRAAKTNRGGTELGITEVPGIYRVVIGRPANGVGGRIQPTATSNTSISSGLRPLRILFRHEPIVIGVIPIINPLADVSDYVVETIAVGLERSDRHGIGARKVCRNALVSVEASGPLWRLDVPFTGIDIIGISPRIVIPVESASRRFLPLGFGWQTFAGPLAVGSRFEPIYVVNGQLLFSSLDLALRPMPRRLSARGCLKEFPVVGVGYLVLVEVEGIQINMVSRPVVQLVYWHKVCGIGVDRIGATHPELASRNLDHVFRRCGLCREWCCGTNKAENGE